MIGGEVVEREQMSLSNSFKADNSTAEQCVMCRECIAEILSSNLRTPIDRIHCSSRFRRSRDEGLLFGSRFVVVSSICGKVASAFKGRLAVCNCHEGNNKTHRAVRTVFATD